MLMWRSGMIGALLLSALLATTRADVLGTRTTGLLAGRFATSAAESMSGDMTISPSTRPLIARNAASMRC